MKLRLRLLFVLMAFAPAGLTAQQLQVELAPTHTEIAFALGASLHTVHGSFKLKSCSLRINPAAATASGQLVADAGSGDSGNHTRDRKMTREILEAQKFPEILFTAHKLTGSLPATGTSQLALSGTFSIHGQEHPLTLMLNVTKHGDTFSATSHFTVPYQQWGMKNPSTLFLRVSDKVEIEINTEGQLAAASSVAASK